MAAVFDEQGYLLTCLAEEAAEIIKAVAKIKRFGLDSKHPEGGDTNRVSLLKECVDLDVIIRMLSTRGLYLRADSDLLPVTFTDRKWKKVEKYMKESKSVYNSQAV